MELSPLEIKSQKFPKKIKGYDTTEVDNFLEIVSKDMETLYGEYYSLKEELVKKNQEITDYKEKDKSISEAILMVQSVSSDIKKIAITEAEIIKKGAATEAENIISNANKKYLEITADINDLLNKKIIIINSIRNLLQTNIDLINREIDKKAEDPLPSKHINTEARRDVSGNNSSVKENPSGNENKTADVSGNTEHNTTGKSIADVKSNEKDLADLLGDIDRFTL